MKNLTFKECNGCGRMYFNLKESTPCCSSPGYLKTPQEIVAIINNSNKNYSNELEFPEVYAKNRKEAALKIKKLPNFDSFIDL
jgi:uncharacterized OB-fold protein